MIFINFENSFANLNKYETILIDRAGEENISKFRIATHWRDIVQRMTFDRWPFYYHDLDNSNHLKANQYWYQITNSTKKPKVKPHSKKYLLLSYEQNFQRYFTYLKLTFKRRFTLIETFFSLMSYSLFLVNWFLVLMFTDKTKDNTICTSTAI